jgi:putative nucleotidyltransferase with HDIG domain
MRRTAVIGVNVVLLLGSFSAAVFASRSADWTPATLVGLLALLALLSDALALEARGQRLSGSFLALVLAMAFLGPAPAVAIGLTTMLVDTLRGPQLRPMLVLNNFATYATFPLVGGLLIWLVRSWGVESTHIEFGIAVAAVYAVTLLLNFALVAGTRTALVSHSFRTQIRTILVPVLPSEAAAAVLVLAFSVAYGQAGFLALAVLVVALLAFQYLTRELILSQERAEQLAIRSTELASLQVGVLTALVQTLSLRDKMTARHSAAVARYAKAMAEAVGCPPEEQELVHTAGLLHDIGKFIFPDRILFADTRLDDSDWEIVKKHPAQGARVVGRVSGYGPVAEIIRAHHERIDGTGYPNGLAAEEIPLLSRMISIADTYDVMTARDSYRKPVSPEEAVAELRRVSGTQLDGHLVEVFVSLLNERGVSFQHTTDADFERELAFERRVAGFLAPSGLPKAA